MMGVIFDFGINVVMALLLGATIFYCWLLNKRIQVLQDSKGDLAKLLNRFDQSTVKAAESIQALQQASKKISDTIQARIEKANYVMDDLSYMIDRASKAADQMEAGIAIARQKDKLARGGVREKVEPDSPTPPEEKRASEKPFAASAKRPETISQTIDLAEIVLGEALLPERTKSDKRDGKTRSSQTLSSLQALIEKVAERKSDPVLRANQKPARRQVSKQRSQSEEELLEAIRFNTKV